MSLVVEGMNNAGIRKAVLELIGLVENGRGNEADNLAALELALDRLALAAHFVRHEYDGSDFPDPPEIDYEWARALVTRWFPAFGFYNIPRDISTNIQQTEMHTGDAVDDLADIYMDLKGVAWAWDKNSEADALWRFNQVFPHTGNHLRDLQWFINALKSEL